MATPYHVRVQPADAGLLAFSLEDSSARKVSELLQKDLEVSGCFCEGIFFSILSIFPQ